MIGGHDFRDPLADLRFLVAVGGVHQGVDARQEVIRVEGDGLADVDFFVGRLPQAFLRHQLFLIQLFSWAQARILNFNILVRFEAGEADQVPGQGVDLHRLAHIQDEDLSALGVGASLHHQAHRLRDGHEIADDVRMGHGHGAALLNLAAEQGDDGAVGTQDVSEADRHKLGPDILEDGAGAVLIGVFEAHVGKELRNFRGPARLDHGVEGLDDHLAQALAGAHDVGGVHGLIRGDQHEALAAVDHGGVGGFIGADGVVLDGFAGAVLHKGHVLMGRGVIDDLGPVGIEDLENSPAVPHGADQRHQVQGRIFPLQLQLDLVGAVFIDIKDDQLLRIVGGDLPAELRSDAAAAARHQDALAVDKVENLLHIRADGLPAQQVLDGNLLHGSSGDLAQDKLIHAGQLLQLAARLVADGQDIPLLLHRGAGDGQENLVDVVFLNRGEDLVPAAHDGHALHGPMPLVGVVVDDADYLVVLHLVRVVQILQDHLPRAAGPDEHHPAGGLLMGAVQAPLILGDPVQETNPRQEDELHPRADDVIGDGHTPQGQGDENRVGRGGAQGHHQRPDQDGEGGEAPHAPIQPANPEDDDHRRRVGQDESQIGFQEKLRNQRVLPVKAKPQPKGIGESDGQRVIDHQQRRYQLPVLHMQPLRQLSQNFKIFHGSDFPFIDS